MQTIPALDPAEDDFANTRPADDLFEDEIVPNPSPPKEDVVIPTGPRAHANGHGRGNRGGGGNRGNRGRGGRGAPRGRGGGGGGNFRGPREAPNTDWKGDGTGSGLASRHAPAGSTAAASVAATPAKVEEPPKLEEKEKEKEKETTEAAEPAAETAEPKGDGEEEDATAPTPPTGPAAGTPRKEFPARNRVTTGGPNRQKLTEEELANRIEAVRLKNQARTEKHMRATEDELKFNEAEAARKIEEARKKAEDRKKQVEDGKRKKELDAEREQNRQRKLKALSNREWDVSKNEEDYNPSNYTNRSRRGAYGGVSGGVISNPDASYSREGDGENAPHESPRGGRGRGRGGRRGDRGDRGGGRGGHRVNTDFSKKETSAPADISNEAEFPALPGAKAKSEKPPETPLEPETPKGTWAEQAQDAAEKAEKAAEATV
ncbi:hypothetical protein ABW19_dt0206042 [Dactylella cylindrospora]|nr:hypothetical protein ABW19_dt0206042 [Dactylella cylindrospora]